MSEFTKNAVITVTAALLAFMFGFFLEIIKRWVDRRTFEKQARSTTLLSLKAAQKILDSIKSRYQDNDFFDYIYIDQLTEIARQQDRLRFGKVFFKRKIDQSTYFTLISRLYLLAASMKSIQQFKDAPSIEADEGVRKSSFVTKKQNELIIEIGQVNQVVDNLINVLDD